jgi:diacylglycerol kinase (ATP)
MSARLILNPAAGSDEALALVARINERLRARYGDLDIVITTGEGDAERAGARSASEGDTRVFVAGGDGTLNEVMNGVYAAGRLGEVTFGLLPVGTGNDFAAGLGLSEDIEASLAALESGRHTTVDVGVLNDRVFVNVSAGGFVAEVSDAVTPGLKTVAGKLAYLIGGAQVLMSYEPVRARVESSSDYEVIHPDGGAAGTEAGTGALGELDLQLFAVCNSRLVGGGRLIAPEAVIDDGWLDVCLIEGMPTLEFVGLLRQVAQGEHVGDERVRYFRVRDLTVHFDRAIKVNTDGQVLEADVCRYRVLPLATRFLAPEPKFTRAALLE